MTRRFLVTTVVVTAVCGGLYFLYGRTSGTLLDVERIYGGPRGIRLLTEAERVETYRLTTDLDEGSFLTDGRIADLAPIAGPINVSSTLATQLSGSLSDPFSYVWNMEKGCEPIYGVRLDFIQGTDRLHVLLCFECNILTTSLNDKVGGSEDFDNARAELVEAVAQIFPDDPEIQALR